METNNSSSSVRRWFLRGIVLVAIAVIAFFALRALFAKSPAPKAAPAVSATLVRVARENVPIFLFGVGTVQAQASVTVKARLDGQLERVDFVEGQDVKVGQVLAQIDARPLGQRLVELHPVLPV